MIALPWPSPKLSPNKRQHWAQLAQAKRRYRAACCSATRSQAAVLVDGPLRMIVEFCPPTKRTYDRDNLLARIKAGLDGMCDALAIDDSRFVVVEVRVGAPVRGGQVVVSLLPERQAVAGGMGRVRP